MKFFWRTTREASLLSPLASELECARFVSETDEVWVTERGSERIEIFSLTGNRALAPTDLGFVPEQGEPESLVVGHERAFTIYGEIVLSPSILGAAKLSTDLVTARLLGRIA